MRLYRLIGLELEALIKEHQETLAKISRYEDILNNYDSMASVIMDDLNSIKREFGRNRRTKIENSKEIVLKESEIEETEVVFLMDRFGYAKTVDGSTYERNKESADAENKYVFSCMNTDKICIFTDLGKMHSFKVLDLPCGRFRDKGIPIDNLCNYNSSKEQMVYVSSLRNITDRKLVFVSRNSMCKAVNGSEFNVTKKVVAATKLANEDDRLILTGILDESDYLVLRSEKGYFLRFPANEVPEKKKTAIGVRGMRLGDRDFISHAYLLANHMEYKIDYKDKKFSLNRLKLAKRDSKGTKKK